MTDDTDADTGTCRCGDEVVVDGDEAIERYGQVLCEDCSQDHVAFVATCENELCPWTYRRDGVAFNEGAVEQLVQSEANTHERWEEVIHDDPTHTTTVEAVDVDTDDAPERGETLVEPDVEQSPLEVLES